MRVLLPFGGFYDSSPRYGIITTPAHRGIPMGIKRGMLWGADNQAFLDKFNPDTFFPWLETLRPYRDNCLFITVPDRWGDAAETLDLFYNWVPYFRGWTLALAAQDGLEDLEFPDPALWDTLFIGGSDSFRDGAAVITCVERALEQGKRIHIGRLNGWNRYLFYSKLERRFRSNFTCDGTKHRYIGTRAALRSWESYHQRFNYQLELGI